MATITQMREGLQARLATISGLRAFDYVKGTVEPPTAIVTPNPGNFLSFDSTMARGSDDLNFLIYVIVSAAVNRLAQEKLDAYCNQSGSTSVKAAIEAEATLAGVVHYARVSGIANYGDIEYSGVPYFGAVFTVEVVSSGS